MRTIVFLISLAVTALALPSNAQVSCAARDTGWEEHWSAHRSCGECLEKHGSCVETCTVEYTTCEIRGRDFRGNFISLKGVGSSRYEAERQGVDNCRAYFNECNVVSCNSANEEVSKRECVKPPTPAPNPNPNPSPNPGPRPPGPVRPTPRP